MTATHAHAVQMNLFSEICWRVRSKKQGVLKDLPGMITGSVVAADSRSVR